MGRGAIAALAVLGSVATVALGFAVSGFASSNAVRAADADSTSEETHESTTETPTVTKWKATLSTGAEVPRPKGTRPGAGGSFTVTVTEADGTYTVAYKLTFRNLTGKAVGAHVHRGKAGKTGPVLIALCGPCSSGRTGKTTVGAAVATAMSTGRAYVNVHTAKNPAGEVRGQVRKAG
jgi:hypothetical protein